MRKRLRDERPDIIGTQEGSVRPDVTSRVGFINTYETKGQFLSDHLPVQAVVKLPTT